MVLHEKYAKEPWRHIGLKVPHHGGLAYILERGNTKGRDGPGSCRDLFW